MSRGPRSCYARQSSALLSRQIVYLRLQAIDECDQLSDCVHGVGETTASIRSGFEALDVADPLHRRATGVQRGLKSASLRLCFLNAGHLDLLSSRAPSARRVHDIGDRRHRRRQSPSGLNGAAHLFRRLEQVASVPAFDRLAALVRRARTPVELCCSDAAPREFDHRRARRALLT